MNYLLDTHTFLWKLANPGKIPATVFAVTKNPDNELFLSSVSLWEIAIKTHKNKLDLGGLLSDDLIDLARKMGIQTIPLLPEEATTYSNLKEGTHTDPFDRMLIWQAICRNMILISSDMEFERFKPDGLKLLWK